MISEMKLVGPFFLIFSVGLVASTISFSWFISYAERVVDSPISIAKIKIAYVANVLLFVTLELTIGHALLPYLDEDLVEAAFIVMLISLCCQVVMGAIVICLLWCYRELAEWWKWRTTMKRSKAYIKVGSAEMAREHLELLA